MNAITSLVVISILMIGGEAQLTCYNCLKLMDEVELPISTNLTLVFSNETRICDDSVVETCGEEEVCGKYEISLSELDGDINGVATYSECVNPGEAAGNFTCAEGDPYYDSLLFTLMDWAGINAITSDADIQCRMYLCYDDLCNTGHTAHISLLVATIISLYQLF